MTVKDQFSVRDHDTTLGYTGRAFKPAAEDAVLVQMLRKLGAVIIAKTNLPQSIMASAIHELDWYLLLTRSSGARQKIRYGVSPVTP